MSRHTIWLLAVSVSLLLRVLGHGQEVVREPVGNDAQQDLDAARQPRDPFWPIGYEPAPDIPEPDEPEEVVEVDTTAVAWPPLPLKGITRTLEGKYIAYIEGVGIVEGPQIVRLKHNDLLYRWKINAITRKGISYVKLDVRVP